MATERELQVACLWGLQDIAVSELREEIITQSPGTQVTYSPGEDVLVMKGSFDDDTESAMVACINAYVEKHMHHNLLNDQPRIHQIIRIDVGAALGSREGLTYVRAPPLIKEVDARDDSPSAPVATVAPIQFSRTWIPSRVKAEYFRKDPHCILDRVAVATSANISLEHSNSKDITIRVSADVREKVHDALQRLNNLDNLLALIDTPHRAFASYVPNTTGLRFGILELAQLNEVAPRRVLVDPKSQIKYSIPEFLVPVSCRIDPRTNSFRISEHLSNPGGIETPLLYGNRQIIECWSGFTYPQVGKPGENRGAQYSGLVVVYQPTLPIAKRGKSQARTSASVSKKQEADTKVTSSGPSRRPLEPTKSEKAAIVGRPPLASRSVSTSSPSTKLPGVKTHRPVLPDGRVPLRNAGPPARSTTPANSEKSTQPESQCSDAHSSANRMSKRPAFVLPYLCTSYDDRKPNAPSRYWIMTDTKPLSLVFIQSLGS